MSRSRYCGYKRHDEWWMESRNDRRNYRQSPLMPDDETLPHIPHASYKKKHTHDYVLTLTTFETRTYYHSTIRHYYCEKCGHRLKAITRVYRNRN